MATKKPRPAAPRTSDSVSPRATRAGRTHSLDERRQEGKAAGASDKPVGTGLGQLAQGGYAEQEPCPPAKRKR